MLSLPTTPAPLAGFSVESNVSLVTGSGNILARDINTTKLVIKATG